MQGMRGIVHDIICKIGEVVVMGGVRRSALISISDLDDVKYSLQDMAKIYSVTKVTIYRWVNVEKVPNISNSATVTAKLNEIKIL